MHKLFPQGPLFANTSSYIKCINISKQMKKYLNRKLSQLKLQNTTFLHLWLMFSFQPTEGTVLQTTKYTLYCIVCEHTTTCPVHFTQIIASWSSRGKYLQSYSLYTYHWTVKACGYISYPTYSEDFFSWSFYYKVYFIITC